MCEIYHYDFEYNHENDTISDKQIEELKGKVEDSLKYYMCSFSNTNYQQYIPIDKICIVDSIDFEDNKILASRCAAVRSFEELSFPVYVGNNTFVTPRNLNEFYHRDIKRYNVEELFPEIIKNINYLEPMINFTEEYQAKEKAIYSSELYLEMKNINNNLLYTKKRKNV